MAQAKEVAAGLAETGIEAELIPMSTSGDEGAPADASPEGLKGLFVDAIVDALVEGALDLAVHSAKDLPADDHEGLVIAAVPPRADPADVLVSKGGERAARVGTSSLRRRAQLLAADPALEVVDIRGNVQTRLEKLATGDLDAIVLAAAGLARLGLEPEHAHRIEPDVMVPAPGQGCLAVQARDDDDEARDAVAALDDPVSRIALETERSLMWRIGGGCSLPLGAHAVVADEAIRMLAVIAKPDGDRLIRVEAEGSNPEDVASLVGARLIEEGVEEVLDEVRSG